MSKIVVGRMSYISIGTYQRIPAKVDTGADASAVSATSISVDDDGVLHYTLFDPSLPYYNGKKHSTHEYKAMVVRSSNGHQEIRYVVRLSVVIEDKRIKAAFSLADRTKNKFPVLLGSRLLCNRFMVDVSDDTAYKQYVQEQSNPAAFGTPTCNTLLAKDPVAFYKDYYLNQE